MKPLDDMLPEEREPQHAELIALLLSHQPTPLTDNEQAEAVARVRTQLLNAQTAWEETLHEDAESAGVDVAAQTPLPFTAKPRRSRRIVRFINALVAVLVVGAIIGASVLLFTHRSPASPAATPSPIGSPVTVRSQADGLEASMSLTPGPYFLGELLAVDISLTNHTHTTYALQGVGVSACDPALHLTQAGGTAPHIAPPPIGIMSCPMMISQLKPGQTIAVHQYIPLNDSGHITLTLGARFLTTKQAPQGYPVTRPGPSPLDGHWPSLQINVHPQVPSDRTISFQLEGTHVIVTAPAGAQSHLLYTYMVDCQDFHDAGGTETGNYAWERISSNKVGLPGCPGKNLHWQFAFAAVGYAYVSGHYPA